MKLGAELINNELTDISVTPVVFQHEISSLNEPRLSKAKAKWVISLKSQHLMGWCWLGFETYSMIFCLMVASDGLYLSACEQTWWHVTSQLLHVSLHAVRMSATLPHFLTMKVSLFLFSFLQYLFLFLYLRSSHRNRMHPSCRSPDYHSHPFPWAYHICHPSRSWPMSQSHQYQRCCMTSCYHRIRSCKGLG